MRASGRGTPALAGWPWPSALRWPWYLFRARGVRRCISSCAFLSSLLASWPHGRGRNCARLFVWREGAMDPGSRCMHEKPGIENLTHPNNNTLCEQ